jgi:GntR family transcriptional regulator
MSIDKQLVPHPSSDFQSPIAFRLDPQSGVPTYLQLVHEVESSLRLGYLKLGDQLPRVKDVVGSLSINPNTVLKAYRELENKGLVAGRPGQGTFVVANQETVGLAELSKLRMDLVTGWLPEAAAVGLDEDGMTSLFMTALRDYRERSRLASGRQSPRGNRRRGAGA